MPKLIESQQNFEAGEDGFVFRQSKSSSVDLAQFTKFTSLPRSGVRVTPAWPLACELGSALQMHLLPCVCVQSVFHILKLIISRADKNVCIYCHIETIYSFSFTCQIMTNFYLCEVFPQAKNFGGILTYESQRQVSTPNCGRTNRTFA